MEKEKNEMDKESCKDEKCPRHGQLSVRGRIFKGEIAKVFGNRAVVTFTRLVYYKKYDRYAKKTTKLHAYLPECFRSKVAVGDLVSIRECRRLSKIVHFVIIEKIK